jgi:hypothetical protein
VPAQPTCLSIETRTARFCGPFVVLTRCLLLTEPARQARAEPVQALQAQVQALPEQFRSEPVLQALAQVPPERSRQAQERLCPLPEALQALPERAQS